ncbi:Wzy polymerase domain-containing protein [Undibacterium sp. CCC2.1]|uniref:PglL family O-oligosaccharyltransferase n=1 Tax=unclassified Undibacterium TaxID=2630295 RepID=UPI002B22FEF2|nr:MULTISPECIES: Wzy polymerase domain-containing protein [unclassified Undibacterium]MEB0139358.1 Wzy polymerase domain-containing protein [Undibacterium sp. CCC2.1]MEB0173377.1 Wzy polymerase domain-containing protein [Undibacterium sp. CCC1.1]MEB0177236.1 Wzy polymerase domain-containing protein [Undibacterium sp. CCC3.4]
MLSCPPLAPALSLKRSALYWPLLACGLALMVAFLLPYHIHPLRVFYHDAAAVIGLLLCLAGLMRVATPRLRLPGVALAPLAVMALILLQYALGLIPIAADIVLPLMYLLLCAVALCVGAQLTVEHEQAVCLLLAPVFLLAGSISVCMQYTQMLGVTAAPWVMSMAHSSQINLRPYANVAQPNQLALLLCFALAGLAFLFEQARVGRRAAVALVLLLLSGLVLTQSRIGWIIVPAFAACLWRPVAGQRRCSVLTLAALCLFYGLLVTLLPLINQLAGLAGGSVTEHIGGRSERLSLWGQAWHIAAAHPWLGAGWFGFGTEQVKVAADLMTGTYAEHAHNLILNLAAELGWPAAALLCAALVYWLRQTCFSAPLSAGARMALMCLVAALVHSMVEFPLWYAYVLIPVALLMGMLHQRRWPSRGRRVATCWVHAAVALACLVLVGVCWDYQRVVAGFRVLRWDASPAGISNPALVAPRYTLFPQYFAYFKLMQMPLHADMAAADIAYFEYWTPRFGFVHILNKLAEVYVLNGQPQAALRMMQTLQRLHPDAYPEYFDYWRAQARVDTRYAVVLHGMPLRSAP